MNRNSVSLAPARKAKKVITVLIVEDHEATLKGLSSELGSTPGLTVVGLASTSEDGLSKMRSLNPDVILLDLHLPDSAGPKSLAQSFLDGGKSKVIVFSGDSRVAIRDLILKSGVSGYLLKSDSMQSIIEAIQSVMAGETQVVSAKLTDGGDGNKLTRAEEHLLTLVARGMKYKDIGKERFTTPETVRKQIEQIQVKLSIESREELIAWAVENGYAIVDAER